MNEAEKTEEKRAHLSAIDAQLREAKQAYKQRKRALKEQRQAVLHDWSDEEARERSAYLAARRKRIARRRQQRRMLSEPPVRPVLEEVGSSVTHGAGAALSVIALILLLMKAHTPVAVFSAVVYGGCLFLMFLMSCLYHAFRAGSTVKRIWRRFDYCSIYLLIGGTITPIQLLFTGGTWGTVLCVAMWVLIAVGITFVGVFGPMFAKALHYSLFFAIGWSAVIFIPRMWSTAPNLLWFVLAGGVVYTLGMIPFVKETRGAHFIWHFFVLLGALLQWLGIWMYVF